jgi:Outer membrane protein beta-barrel domain
MRQLRARIVLVVTLAAISASTTAAAQGLESGLKGGVNLATLGTDEDPAPDLTFRLGIVAGGYVRWKLGDRLDVQTEGLFSQQGAAASAVGVDGKIKVDYAIIPILARYRLSSSGEGLVVYGGAVPGVKLRAQATAESGGQAVKTDISDDIETFDFGVAFGGAFEFGRWSIDGRYTLGLISINADPENDAKIKNRLISGLVGVRLW